MGSTTPGQMDLGFLERQLSKRWEEVIKQCSSMVSASGFLL